MAKILKANFSTLRKMSLTLKNLVFLLVFVLLGRSLHSEAATTTYKFFVKETWYERMCESKKILTVNDQFPGPTLYVNRGDTIYVDVYNKADHNITIHWHGVKQPRNPWADGPEYITQCPIQPGKKFRQKVIFSDEEGTLWWHAHSDWSRATVHGAIVIYPKQGTTYPFPQPDSEVPIILGEWWKKDVMEVLQRMVATGAPPNVSDGYMINGQPGAYYPCSNNDIFQLNVAHEKTYLLRIVNAALNEILFFAVAKHQLTVVGSDGSYTKPFTVDYIAISPGQTFDCLLHANQQPDLYYYMAAKPYANNPFISFSNTTTTAILKYDGNNQPIPSLQLPYLPSFDDLGAVFNFSGSLKSLSDQEHPIDVPVKLNKKLEATLAINTLPCPSHDCGALNGTRLGVSMNNISFTLPTIDILEAYYYHTKGVFGKIFPKKPPSGSNYTGDYLPLPSTLAKKDTQVIVVEYNATVEMTFQNTNLFYSIDHPMHLHGHSFYVVGMGLGNFDRSKDSKSFNLVDPPELNTVVVPKNGWTTIRFRANNPGVWFMHCHFERHQTWGMETVVIVKDGKSADQSILPPPNDMPPC